MVDITKTIVFTETKNLWKTKKSPTTKRKIDQSWAAASVRIFFNQSLHSEAPPLFFQMYFPFLEMSLQTLRTTIKPSAASAPLTWKPKSFLKHIEKGNESWRSYCHRVVPPNEVTAASSVPQRIQALSQLLTDQQPFLNALCSAVLWLTAMNEEPGSSPLSRDGSSLLITSGAQRVCVVSGKLFMFCNFHENLIPLTYEKIPTNLHRWGWDVFHNPPPPNFS